MSVDTLPSIDRRRAAANVRDEPLPLSSTKPARLVSLDAYRGLAMLFMVSEILRIPEVASHFPDSVAWQRAGHWLDHVPWRGGTVWDMIQPSFMFMVGVAVPFSIASRLAKGQAFGRMLPHAVWRSVLLVLLGMAYVSVGKPRTWLTFNNVLTQIGLGYTFLFLLAWTKPRWQIVAAVALLAGDWIAFAAYPAPKSGFNFATVGIKADWPHHLTGFAAHWDKETNVAAAFDRWLMNRYFHWFWPEGYPGNPQGYHTLNFVPSLATMTFGLLAGELLRSAKPAASKLITLILAGIVGLAVGFALDALNVCPIVKRIWTPSWALYAGGWTCLTLAVFYYVLDVARVRFWAFPLTVVGMNSIAMYLMSGPTAGFLRDQLHTHFGRATFLAAANPLAPLWEGAIVLCLLWLICLWMYRRRIFLKV